MEVSDECTAAFGIKDVVDGTRQVLRDLETAEGKSWVRDNAKAMVLISPSIEHTQLESLLVCSTSKLMWDNLQRSSNLLVADF